MAERGNGIRGRIRVREREKVREREGESNVERKIRRKIYESFHFSCFDEEIKTSNCSCSVVGFALKTDDTRQQQTNLK